MPKHRPRVVAKRVRRARAFARRGTVVQPVEIAPASRRWLTAAVVVALGFVVLTTEDGRTPASTPIAASDRSATREPAPVGGPDQPPQSRPVQVDLPPAEAAASIVLTAGDHPLSADGLPAVALAAYQRAVVVLANSDPGCGLRVELLAAIGKVESNHAGNGRVSASGVAVSPILGPALNGNGFAAITDTDGGSLDGDPVWDRAMGPMQFIPSTWASWRADGDGDGRADPQNLFDAALAAGLYLCAGGRDLAADGDLRAAILSYNRSEAYLRTVLAWMAHYSGRLTVRVQAEVETEPAVIAAGAEVSAEVAAPQPPQATTAAAATSAPPRPGPSRPSTTPGPTTTPPVPPAPTTGPPADLIGTVEDGLGEVVSIACAEVSVRAGSLALSLLSSHECQDGSPTGSTGLLGGLLGGA